MKTYFAPTIFLLLLTLIPSINTAANEIRAIDSTDKLSSSQLVTAVLQANPKIEEAQASLRASIANIETQSTLDDPQFQYRFAPLTINSHRSDGRQLSYGQHFEISQKIPFPGKLSLSAKAAEYLAKTRQLDIMTLRLLLATQAKSLFADWYFIHQAIAINQSTQNLLKTIRNIALTRYSTGRTSKQDILSVEVEQELLKHQAIVLKRQQKTILAKLNTLLNRPVESNLPSPQKPTDINELPDFESLKNKAIASRPELKTSIATIAYHQTRTELAALDYYPDLKLSAGYNSLWDNEDKRFSMGVSINLPLNQSKRRAAQQKAIANRQQAKWHKTDLEARINEELAIAYAQAEESLHVLHLYRQRLSPLALENLSAAKANYQAGKGDFLTLLNGEKNLLQTRLQTERALADVQRSLAALERATGSLENLLPDNNTDEVSR